MELILLKVIKVENAWFVTIVFLIMDLNFKIVYVMIWQCCLYISDIANITVKNDYCYIMYSIDKSEAIHLLKNSFLENHEYL